VNSPKKTELGQQKGRKRHVGTDERRVIEWPFSITGEGKNPLLEGRRGNHKELEGRYPLL